MSHTIFVIQFPNGGFHQSGIDAPDREVLDPLDADNRSWYLLKRDALPDWAMKKGAILQEFTVTAVPTGRIVSDLYDEKGEKIDEDQDQD